MRRYDRTCPIYWSILENFRCYVSYIGDLCIFFRHSFDDESYMEFSKHIQDRIIGTKDETARVSFSKLNLHIVLKGDVWACPDVCVV